MIQDQLKTAFPWYNDINKQNRYKDSCDAVVDYKLLTPINNILPFIIATGDNGISVTTWKVYSAYDDSEIDDISSQIASNIDTTEAGGQDYIIYDGSAISGLDLPCGNYYSILITSGETWYSEIFHVLDIDSPLFYQMDFPLFTAWRWYDNQLKQNRYKEACLANCDFALISGNDALLPFMFRTLSLGNLITNGTFDTDLSGWNAQASGWVWNAGTAYINVSATKRLTQAVTNLIIGRTYTVQFDLLNHVAGNLRVEFLDSVFNDFSADGTYTITTTYNGVLGNIVFANFSLGTEDFAIDNVNVFEGNMAPDSWILRSIDGECEIVLDFFVNTNTVGDYDYIVYYGDSLSNLGCGVFESILTINGVTYYSELIQVIDTVDTLDDTNYLLQENGSRILQETGFGILLE